MDIITNKNKISHNPSLSDLQNLFYYYQNGQIVEARELALSIIKFFPKNQFAWTVLGSIFEQTGKYSDAVNVYLNIVSLSPYDAVAHFNLGNLLQKLGRLNDAIERYIKAITLNPKFAEAQNNLGNTYKTKNDLDNAKRCYIKAVTLKTDYAEAHYNLGVVFHQQNMIEKAYHSYIKAISLKSDFSEAYLNFTDVFKKMKFNSLDPKLYHILSHIISNESFVRPSEISRYALNYLKQDPLIKDLLTNKTPLSNFEDFKYAVNVLNKFKLLNQLMSLCPIPDLDFETFFISMRNFYISNIDNIQISPELINFLSSLSLQCFTNEYIYYESDNEKKLIKELEYKIIQAFEKSEQPEERLILCLASYRPLHQYNWCKKNTALNKTLSVKKRLIEEPLIEKKITQEIPSISEITDKNSLKVKKQYEENPYPRWVKSVIFHRSKSISEVCNEINLHLYSKKINEVTAPSLLIAGCGTGQNSIESALRFCDSKVTAIDLSISSLAFAQRKTDELGIKNIKYLQADILDLNKLEKKFDIIESLGVLHHLDNPIDGWKTLQRLLKPNGLMKIGLYSKLARGDISEARKKNSTYKKEISLDEIRSFRSNYIFSKTKDKQSLSRFMDFFSMSEFRDLIFHVTEHCFTLPQIQDSLDTLGLKFCGFENNDIISRFKSSHSKETDIYDLQLWHRFEEENPNLFSGMYQFWCQKL